MNYFNGATQTTSSKAEPGALNLGLNGSGLFLPLLTDAIQFITCSENGSCLCISLPSQLERDIYCLTLKV